MTVVIIGPGLMGAQIGVEYALGGHAVAFVGRRPEAARERVARAFALAREMALWDESDVAAAADRATVVGGIEEVRGEPEIVVESIVEDLGEKGRVLAPVARRFPNAILATNTSAIPITAIGEAAGAAERTIGAHYANPPMLMPPVEVIRGERTTAAVVERMLATLRALGKRPIVCEKDVPGFVWNRMQLALLREAVWLVEQGVATPAAVDAAVREMLARRWRYTGPFQTAALGGADTFQRIADNLWPVLSTAETLADLRRWLDASPETNERTKAARDAGLLRELRRETAPTPRPSPEHGRGESEGGFGASMEGGA